MKVIKLKENGIGRYTDVSPFPLGNLSLKITGLPLYGAGEYRLILFINSWDLGSYTLYPKGENIVSIPQNKLSAGKLSCYVAFYQSGREVKRYPVEDLIITDLNKQLTAYPELAQIEANIASVLQKVNENKESNNAKIERLTQMINTQNLNHDKIVLGLTKNYNSLSQSLNALSRTVTELQNVYMQERQKVLALLKFAWTDFANNVYIDGDTFEDFIKKFGFDLTDEEIYFIKGGDLK